MQNLLSSLVCFLASQSSSLDLTIKVSAAQIIEAFVLIHFHQTCNRRECVINLCLVVAVWHIHINNLQHVFERRHLNPPRLHIASFGSVYCVSVDPVFPNVVAYSPCPSSSIAREVVLMDRRAEIVFTMGLLH